MHWACAFYGSCPMSRQKIYWSGGVCSEDMYPTLFRASFRMSESSISCSDSPVSTFKLCEGFLPKGVLLRVEFAIRCGIQASEVAKGLLVAGVWTELGYVSWGA